MPVMSSQTKLPREEEADELEFEYRPLWRRRPCRSVSAVTMDAEELTDKMDAYFEKQFDEEKHPSFCDLAGATGFDSLTQMMNHARRRGGPVMRSISRALLAVGAGYEEQAQEGSRTAAVMLERLPQFDTEEPAEQLPTLPFQRQQELKVDITGLARVADRGAQLTEQEAYLRLIKHKTYKEVEADTAVLDTQQDEAGEYHVLEIQDD